MATTAEKVQDERRQRETKARLSSDERFKPPLNLNIADYLTSTEFIEEVYGRDVRAALDAKADVKAVNRVSRTTVHNAINDNRLKGAFYFNRVWYIPRDHVRDFRPLDRDVTGQMGGRKRWQRHADALLKSNARSRDEKRVKANA